jgi:hypothetical protein
MSVTDREQMLEPPTVAQPPAQPSAQYETCEQCEAPVETNQRYCVVCGTRRRHVYDPAARFLADTSSRSRSATRIARGPAVTRRRSPGLGLALALAAIPLAVAAGGLIAGRGDDSNSKLLAALRAQKPTVVNVNGGGATGAATSASRDAGGGAATTASVVKLTSSFALPQGYAVELQALPGSGTTAATVTAAEHRARKRGATAVGLIGQADFQITPKPPTGDYVIYSGQYHSSADATAALGKLKHGFPGAKVIAVKAVGTSDQVLAKTSYGSAHEVDGFKPTASQLSSGGKVASQVSKEINGNYVKAQQGLPDSISVP